LTPIRIAIWAWDANVDDLEAFGLPSILQPNNIPWLVQNGVAVTLDFYTVKADEARVRALAEAAHDRVRTLATGEPVTATLTLGPDGMIPRDTRDVFFRAVAEKASDTGSRVIIAVGNRFFGDGSIRNMATYARKPRVTVSGLHLPVERDRFAELVRRHMAARPDVPIGNARLVDIALESQTAGMRASWTDDDTNASYQTGRALRALGDDLSGLITHAPIPLLSQIEPNDLTFFDRFLWSVPLFETVWPSMLIAQNRWRVMASSDLCCVAEIRGAPAEDEAIAPRPGMRYNDDFAGEQIAGRVHQTMLMALRRERLV
jgi:hypothetical protein